MRIGGPLHFELVHLSEVKTEQATLIHDDFSLEDQSDVIDSTRREPESHLSCRAILRCDHNSESGVGNSEALIKLEGGRLVPRQNCVPVEPSKERVKSGVGRVGVGVEELDCGQWVLCGRCQP